MFFNKVKKITFLGLYGRVGTFFVASKFSAFFSIKRAPDSLRDLILDFKRSGLKDPRSIENDQSELEDYYMVIVGSGYGYGVSIVAARMLQKN